MGARPSQYIAEIIQAHLPQGDMTGQQLFHVINNVLQEGAGRRTEIEGLTYHKPGDLGPKSGTSYDQWRQIQNDFVGPKQPEQDPATSAREKARTLMGIPQ